MSDRNIKEIEHQIDLNNETNDQTANNEADIKYNKDCGAENCRASVKYQSLPEAEKEETKIEINDNYSKFSLTYSKAGLLFLTIALNILTTFLRGSNKAESVIGLKQCDTLSWVIFGI